MHAAEIAARVGRLRAHNDDDRPEGRPRACASRRQVPRPAAGALVMGPRLTPRLDQGRMLGNRSDG
jgi:hypothetical protein